VVEAAGPANELLALLDSYGVSGKQLHQIGDRLTLVISRENLHDEPRVREALAGQSGNRVRIIDDLGALSVVGAGINASFSNLRRGSDALTAAGILPQGVATSSFRITWMVDRARLTEAVRILHATFIEQPGPPVP
jgi:aspartate kinase